jgi:hypothetical protein
VSVEFVALAILILVVLALVQLFIHYAPGIFLDTLDHLIWKLPTRPFLAVAPTENPFVRSLTMATVLVCGFGMVLSLARWTGLWIVWPAAASLLFLAVGFGVAFATMLWPAALTAGFIVIWFGLGILERAGGEPVPFPEDGARVSVLNVTIFLTLLLSAYASATAIRARKLSARRDVD